jgi:hypothetical protein
VLVPPVPVEVPPVAPGPLPLAPPVPVELVASGEELELLPQARSKLLPRNKVAQETMVCRCIDPP